MGYKIIVNNLLIIRPPTVARRIFITNASETSLLQNIIKYCIQRMLERKKMGTHRDNRDGFKISSQDSFCVEKKKNPAEPKDEGSICLVAEWKIAALKKRAKPLPTWFSKGRLVHWSASREGDSCHQRGRHTIRRLKFTETVARDCKRDSIPCIKKAHTQPTPFVTRGNSKIISFETPTFCSTRLYPELCSFFLVGIFIVIFPLSFGIFIPFLSLVYCN